jgi:hypothetical protein
VATTSAYCMDRPDATIRKLCDFRLSRSRRAGISWVRATSRDLHVRREPYSSCPIRPGGGLLAVDRMPERPARMPVGRDTSVSQGRRGGPHRSPVSRAARGLGAVVVVPGWRGVA